MKKPESIYLVYLYTFLTYTSIHALRTSYSFAKSSIGIEIGVSSKSMGIVDCLMLSFLGIGHFIHAIYPISRPVKYLWMGTIACGINYAFIPFCMLFPSLTNIYMLSVLMCVNGFLQSYTWPNLLMIIHSHFDPAVYTVLLGFWATNANVGNIIGYSIFQVMQNLSYEGWKFGLFLASTYAICNGFLIKYNLNQIQGLQIQEKETHLNSDISFIPKKDMNFSNYSNYSENSLEDSLLEVRQKPTRSTQISPATSLDQISRCSKRSLKTPTFHFQKEQIIQHKEFKRSSSISTVAEEIVIGISNVFNDINVVLLTITFALAKSVIYGIMLWLPLYFKMNPSLISYAAKIPITYDFAAIFGSVLLGFLFKNISNKGIIMIPFMVSLFICFLFLRILELSVGGYFFVIAIVGFSLGGTFNTLSGLVVMQLIKVIPQQKKTTSLGFYSALTMAVGNFTTAFTQILIGFVIGKQRQEGIFFVFMLYAFICLICLVYLAYVTNKNQQCSQTNKEKEMQQMGEKHEKVVACG